MGKGFYVHLSHHLLIVLLQIFTSLLIFLLSCLFVSFWECHHRISHGNLRLWICQISSLCHSQGLCLLVFSSFQAFLLGVCGFKACTCGSCSYSHSITTVFSKTFLLVYLISCYYYCNNFLLATIWLVYYFQ